MHVTDLMEEPAQLPEILGLHLDTELDDMRVVPFKEKSECILLGMSISEVGCNVVWRLHTDTGRLKGRAVSVVVLQYPLHFS